MKLNYKFFIFIILTVFFLACDDDNYYGDGYDSEFNSLYSNKTYPQVNSGNLILNYSDSEFDGVDVYFEMQTKNTAQIKLFNVIPGEKNVVLENVQVVKSDKGFTFTGNSTTYNGTSLKYSGNVEKGKLSLELKDINLPENILSKKGTWKLIDDYILSNIVPGKDDEGEYINIFQDKVPIYLLWESTYKTGQNEEVFGTLFGTFIKPIASNLLHLVLDDVTFHKDGNITASYSNLPDKIDFLELIQDMPNVWEKELYTSPINTAMYYVEDNSVYVKINIEKILGLVSTNGSIDINNILSGSGLTIMEITQIYSLLNTWSTKGIKFNLVENTPIDIIMEGNKIQLDFFGDYRLYLDGKELTTLRPIIYKLVQNLVNDDIKTTIGNTVDGFLPGLGTVLVSELDAMIESIPYTTRFDIGLYLSEEY